MPRPIRTTAVIIVLGGILLLSVVLLALRLDLDIGFGINGDDARSPHDRVASEGGAAQHSDQPQATADLLTIVIDDGTPVSSTVESKTTENIPE